MLPFLKDRWDYAVYCQATMDKQQNKYKTFQKRSNRNNNSNYQKSNGSHKSQCHTNQQQHHQQSHHKAQKHNAEAAATITISSVKEFPASKTYGSLDYCLPSKVEKITSHTINDLPSFPQRPAAKWSGVSPLGLSLLDQYTGSDPSIRARDLIHDPVMEIVLVNRKNAKTLKLGSTDIDLSGKQPVLTTKLVNKFIQKESLSNQMNTPMKRVRDEAVDASSSVKKNKRIASVTQADTTMELSFEGKAMDKSDLVKLVDSSGVMQDESQIAVDMDASMIDTRNLLQSTEFNFEYYRRT